VSGNGGIASSFLMPSGQLHAPVALPPGRSDTQMFDFNFLIHIRRLLCHSTSLLSCNITKVNKNVNRVEAGYNTSTILRGVEG
jgi:hypothetical protein